MPVPVDGLGDRGVGAGEEGFWSRIRTLYTGKNRKRRLTVLLREVTRPLTEWDVVWANRVIKVTSTTAMPKIHLGFSIERPRSLTDKSDRDRGEKDMAMKRTDGADGHALSSTHESKSQKERETQGTNEIL